MVLYSTINKRVQDVAKILIRINGKMVKVKKIIIHPNYLDSLPKGSCDLALLELEQPLTTILPARLNTNFDELKSDVVGVGFGASGPANNPELISPQNKKIAGENIIDTIIGAKYGGYETLLECDFDSPDRKDCHKMGSSVPKPFVSS